MDRLARILIIDDERFNINVLVDLLRSDYDVLVAKNGQQALKRAHASIPPDLILLDVMMPGMSGYEVCKHLKADPLTEGIPIVFISAMDKSGDEEIGLKLGAVDYITKPFSPTLVKLRVGIHLKLKRQNDMLRDLATIDGLTGIPNRRLFDQHLDQELRRSVHNQSSLSLILMDIDFFKPYNDNYGHAEGDECLKKVARALAGVVGRVDHLAVQSTGRPMDLVARYGGEEFACILPDMNCLGAEVFGEKLRNTIVTLNLPHEHSKVASHVTISLGGTTCIPTHQDTPLELIEKADQNLYRAKGGGRNRVIVSEA